MTHEYAEAKLLALDGPAQVIPLERELFECQICSYITLLVYELEIATR
jgi:hypothetical protein